MAFNFPDAPTVGQTFQGYTWDGEKWIVAPISTITGAVVRGYISGLTLSTPGSSGGFTVAPGVAANSVNTVMMSLAAAIGKNGAANWVVGGAGVGSLDTGAFTPNTSYHVHLIRRPDTGVVDVLTSLSPTAPTLPANYTQFRRIGSMRSDANGFWTKFIQTDDLFTLDVPVKDIQASNPGIAAVMRALSVPTGISVIADIGVLLSGPNMSLDYPASGLISDPAQADSNPGSSNYFANISLFSNVANQITTMVMVSIKTNTSGQVRSRIEHSTSGTLLLMVTHGWTDTRGRNT